jgi:hypothetical protein
MRHEGAALKSAIKVSKLPFIIKSLAFAGEIRAKELCTKLRTSTLSRQYRLANIIRMPETASRLVVALSDRVQ